VTYAVGAMVAKRLLGLVSTSMLCLVAAASAASPALGPVSVHVAPHLSIDANPRIKFRPHGKLPPGGYYYAIVVLQHYSGAPQKTPPACAISSNMERTDYGYLHRGRPVSLTLLPAQSSARHWCAGGTYTGAVYAVPHKPPCSYYYPCTGKSAEVSLCEKFQTPPPCVAGTVPAPVPTQAEREEKERAQREAREQAERETKGQAEREARERTLREAIEDAPYSYPGGLPRPHDHSTRVVGYFVLQF
jgi:hypothetical protein